MIRRFRDWTTDRFAQLQERLGRWAVSAWLLAGLALLIAATTAMGIGLAALPSGSQDSFDLGVARWLAERRVDWVTGLAWAATYVGDTIALLIVGAIVGLAWRWRRGDWVGLAVPLGAYLGALALYSAVKRLVARGRPPVELALGEVPGQAFPSGHTTGSAAVYVALTLLLVVLARAAWQRAAIVGVIGTLVVVIGLSRVYLGVHWLGDVLGGLFAGAAWAFVVMTPVWARRRRRVLDGQTSGPDPGHRLPTTGDDQALANS